MWLRVIGVLGGSILLLGLLFPAHHGHGDNRRAMARHDIMSLVTALKAYRTEYGGAPLPEIARFEDEATQARLLRVLQALDQDHKWNPRRVVFFETQMARNASNLFSKAKYRSGIHPHSGALMDRWGNPYRVRVAPSENGPAESPYSDVDEQELRTQFIAWSVGKDGVQGSRGKENILEGSDDIVSWRW